MLRDCDQLYMNACKLFVDSYGKGSKEEVQKRWTDTLAFFRQKHADFLRQEAARYSNEEKGESQGRSGYDADVEIHRVSAVAPSVGGTFSGVDITVSQQSVEAVTTEVLSGQTAGGCRSVG